jgi:hypothetical protein
MRRGVGFFDTINIANRIRSTEYVLQEFVAPRPQGALVAPRALVVRRRRLEREC